MDLPLPDGFYSVDPVARVRALRQATTVHRQQLLGSRNWPAKSPGALNSWLVFLGPSPGASPSSAAWPYDPLPSVGGAHPGVELYTDAHTYWHGIRAFARSLLPMMEPADAYATTMVRNLDEAESAVAPTGAPMRTAARQVVDVLDAVIKPVLIIALGGVRPYSDRAFGSLRGVRVVSRGVLHTSIKRQERPWSVSRGTWRSGHPFLYVSASGIHPSLPMSPRKRRPSS